MCQFIDWFNISVDLFWMIEDKPLSLLIILEYAYVYYFLY